MNKSFDPYLKWLGIRDPQRPPNHYRLLGIDPFESDPDVIATAADRQMAHVRRYQSGQHSQVSQDVLNELAAAKLLLLNPSKKAIYDRTLSTSEPAHVGGAVGWGRWAMIGALAAAGILAVVIVAMNRGADDGATTMEAADAEGDLVSPAIVAEASLPTRDNAEGNQDVTAGDPMFDIGTIVPILPATPDPDPSFRVNDLVPDTGDSHLEADHVDPPWVTETIERQPYEIRQTGTVLDDIRQAIAEGDLEEARRELTAAEKDAPSGDPTLAGLRAITTALGEFHLAVLAALKGGAPVETRLEYGRSTVVIENIDESSIVLRSPQGETKAFPAAPLELPAMLAATLAKYILEKEVDSRSDLIIGAFWAFDERGNQFKAQVCLEGARRLIGSEVDMMLESWRVPVFGGQDIVRTKQAGRLSVPERKEIARTWRQLQSELPARIAKQKFQAADLLLTRASQESDSARRYVLLDFAARYASQSDNTVAALTAIDGIVTDFDVDVLEIRRSWLEKLTSTTDPRHAAQVAQAAMFAMEESFDADEYSQAQKFLAIANSTAKKTGDRILVNRAAELRERLSVLKTSYRETAAARRTLAQDPDDPAANAAAGRFLCFEKGDFARGLPHFAKSNDETLRTLAERTLNVENNPNELTDVANGWWAVAENLSGSQQSTVLSYAVAWYKKAEPRVSGAQLELVKQRLSAAKPRSQIDPAIKHDERR